MNIDRDKLKAFVERIERLDDEAQALNDDRKEVYDEAKEAQFDVSALKAVISTRRKQRKNPDQFEARETLIDAYMHALGTEDATRGRAREVGSDGTVPPGSLEIVSVEFDDALQSKTAVAEDLDVRTYAGGALARSA